MEELTQGTKVWIQQGHQGEWRQAEVRSVSGPKATVQLFSDGSRVDVDTLAGVYVQNPPGQGEEVSNTDPASKRNADRPIPGTLRCGGARCFSWLERQPSFELTG